MIGYTTLGTNNFDAATSFYDGNAATVGNGVMVAVRAKSTDEVATLYNKAIELGGTDEGAPG